MNEVHTWNRFRRPAPLACARGAIHIIRRNRYERSSYLESVPTTCPARLCEGGDTY